MSGPKVPGEFEQIVLLAILRLEENAYGVSIREEIRRCIGRTVTPGAIYTTLERLEAKGLVTSTPGEPTAERGGRAKCMYTVTKQGCKLLRQAQLAFRAMAAGLEILEESHG